MLPSSIVNLYEFTNPEELQSKKPMTCSTIPADGFYVQMLFPVLTGIFMQKKTTDDKGNILAFSPVVSFDFALILKSFLHSRVKDNTLLFHRSMPTQGYSNRRS